MPGMKNGMLIWNIGLTAVAGLLLFLYFDGNKKDITVKTAGSDTARGENPTRIAYIDMDSVQENYRYAKDFLSEIKRLENANNLELEKLGEDLKKKWNAYAQQDQAAGLSQLSDVHQQELMAIQKRVDDRKQVLEQDYIKYVNQNELKLRNNIKDFLKEFNSDRKYSYIMSYEDRMFYYVDTLYNITTEVIKGLNDKYTTKKP
jgi:outer membrane protein